MTRLASMIAPLLVAAAALTASVAQAGDTYERVGPNRYKPTDGAWYSSTCCYKKIIKHITITKEVWVKVPPPATAKPRPQALRPHHHHHHMANDDDDAVETPRPAPKPPHKVVEMGQVFQSGNACRKAVPVKDGTTTVIVLVNVHCR